MNTFLLNRERYADIEEELRYRNVSFALFSSLYTSRSIYDITRTKWLQVEMFGFYDVVIDFILLDAFEDLSRPPSAVLAVARNSFISDSFKESVSCIYEKNSSV